MKDEEEYRDDNVIDHACSQQASSTVYVDQGYVFSNPCQNQLIKQFIQALFSLRSAVK